MRKLSLVIFGGLVTLLLGYFHWPKNEAPSPVSGSFLFPEGEYKFSLNMASKGSINTAAIAKSKGADSVQGLGSENLETKISATLIVHSSLERIQLHLNDAKVQLSGNAVAPEDIGVNDSPITVLIDRFGHFTSIVIPENQSAVFSGVWLSILSQIQVVRGGELDSWESEETDYQTKYSVTYDFSSHVLLKSKGKIIESKLANKSGDQQLFFENQAWTAELKNGSLANLVSHDEIVLKTKVTETFRNTLDFHIGLKSFIAGPQKMASAAQGKTLRLGLDTLSEVSAQATEQSRFRQDMGEISFDTIVQGLQKEMTEGEETEFYKKIRGYIFLHPEKCRDFDKILIDAPYNGLAMNTVGMAMGRIGHSAAQASLRNVITERINTKLSVANYLHLLAQAKQPDPESLDLLEVLSHKHDKELQEAAVLSSGLALSSQRIHNPTDAIQRLAAFQLRFEKAMDPNEKNLLMDLIGNSEMPEGLDSIEAQLASHEDGKTRLLAIEAMRMIDDPRARSNLVALLTSTSLDDRITAANALKYQVYMPDVLANADEAFQLIKPEEAKLRRQYLDWLFNHQNSVPDLKLRLAKILSKEDDTDNRKVASGFADMLKVSN